MSLRRNKDGSWVIRYYPDGRRGGERGRQRESGRRVQETLGPLSHAEAKRIYQKRLAEAAFRKRGEVPPTSIREIAQKYLELNSVRMAQSSIQRAEEILRCHLLPRFGEMDPQMVRSLDLEEYQRHRLNEGASPATVNRELTVLKAVLNKAEAWELIESNPIRRGAVPSLATPRGRLVYFEREEWERFICAFDDDDRWRDYLNRIRIFGTAATIDTKGLALGGSRKQLSEASSDYLKRLRATVPVFKALLYTGSRLQEILDLRWEAVDLRRNIISIHQRKSGKTKIIPISTSLRTLLLSVPQGVGKAHVFTRADRTPFSVREVQRAFKVAQRISGIREDLTPHSLRHTFASWLAIEGVPLRTIQELLGHADIRMSVRYAHLSPSHLREAVEVLNERPRDRERRDDQETAGASPTVAESSAVW